MSRVCAVSLFLALLAPASASAAPFGELTPLSLPGEDECVVATGMPGELATTTKTGVRFLRATRDGLALAGTVKVAGTDCGAIVSRPGGAGVIAGLAGDGDVVATLREPGGTWGASTIVARTSDWVPDSVSAAVSDRGDVLIVWREGRYENGGAYQYRSRAVRRAPGGAFGPEEQIGPVVTTPGHVIPAIAATGEAFVLWTIVEAGLRPLTVPVRVSMAAPGAPFAAPVELGTIRWLSTPALAVAADGRALVAIPDGKSLRVAERPPGGAFGPPAPLARAGDPARVVAAAQLGAHGEAVVAWAGEFSGRRVATRQAPGLFSPPVPVTPDTPRAQGMDPIFYSEAFWATLPLLPIEFPFFAADPGALALSADGRALVGGSDGRVATLPLGAGTPAAHGVAGPLTYISTTSALTLEDGTPALAWTDPDYTASTERYRLHLSVEGVPERADGPVPRVRFGKPSGQRLPVTCSGPCELRGFSEAGAGHTLMPAGGKGELQVGAILPEGLHSVRVRVSYGAPDARFPRERTIVMRIRGRVPVARVERVRAVRHGDAIRVTWRTDREAMGLFPFLVSGTATRAWSVEPLSFASTVPFDDRRTFSVTLQRAKGVRYVTVQSFAFSFSNNPRVVVGVN